MSSSTLDEFLKTKSPQGGTAETKPEDSTKNRTALQSFLGTQLDANANAAPLTIKRKFGAAALGKSVSIPKVQTQFPAPAPVATAPAPTPAVAAPVATPVAAKPAAAPTATPVAMAPGKPFPWFKHIQQVESAIRIGDLHFAETLVSVLTDVADVLDDAPTRIRLKSLTARIKLEQRQIPEAEKLLQDTLTAAENTPTFKTIGAAYCLHVLAQCYQRGGKADKAQKAQIMSVKLAEELLGAADPEAKMFRQPLAV